MNGSLRSKAMGAVWSAAPKVRSLILEEARLHLQARQLALHALEQRVTQAAVILMAAAAVAAGLAFATGIERPIAGLVGISGALFAAGGCASFMGLRAGALHLPFTPPSWWGDQHGVPDMELADAQTCLAAYVEDIVDSLEADAARRARALNLGLRYGAWGAGLVGLAAVLALFR